MQNLAIFIENRQLRAKVGAGYGLSRVVRSQRFGAQRPYAGSLASPAQRAGPLNRRLCGLPLLNPARNPHALRPFFLNEPPTCLSPLKFDLCKRIRLATFEGPNLETNMPFDSVAKNEGAFLPSRSVQRQRLLADVAQLFLGTKPFSEQINLALQWMGADAEVNRIYIFEDNIDGLSTSNTFEWCNSGIEPQIQELQGADYAMIPNWNRLLDRDGRIFSTNIHLELPEDLLAVLVPQGIKSILIIPLHRAGRRFGFIRFDECTRNREWAQEDLELLRSLSGVLSSSYEREHIRAQLNLGEIRLSMALENAGTGLWDWNMESGSLSLNKEGGRMLGLEAPAHLFLMQDWKDRMHPTDLNAFAVNMDEMRSGQRVDIDNSHQVKTAEGPWKWVRIQGKVVEWTPANKAQRAVGTLIDIDKQKRIEEELRHLNTSKDLFFSVLAHDLKAPLLSIMQMAASTKGNENLKQSDWHALLSAQESMAKNSLNLLENLFHWAGFQKGPLAFFPENFDAFEIAKMEIEHLQQALDFKSIQIDLAEFSPQHVFADKVLLGIVFRNLLHNAIKFSHQKGRILLRSKPNGPFVHFEIQDFGLGILREHSSSLLQEDFFKSSFGTNGETGSGIGLKICKKFIQQQGGDLSFHSEPNSGCTFCFFLPVFKEQQ